MTVYSYRYIRTDQNPLVSPRVFGGSVYKSVFLQMGIFNFCQQNLRANEFGLFKNCFIL